MEDVEHVGELARGQGMLREVRSGQTTSKIGGRNATTGPSWLDFGPPASLGVLGNLSEQLGLRSTEALFIQMLTQTTQTSDSMPIC